MSVQMFDDIVKSLKTENENVLKEHGLDDKDVTFIKELIEGAKDSAAEVHTDTLSVIDVIKPHLHTAFAFHFSGHTREELKTNPSCMRLWQTNRMALMWTNGTISHGKYY